LIAGNGEAHRELESFISRWKGTEAALVFGSGYQANVGVLSSLMTAADLIVSDQLNHASIVDGCRLSKARVEVYPHQELNRLEDFLRLGGFRSKLVVTESVFSMDGDKAPLKEIEELCRRWGALLMVDEAHATGVLGPHGEGLASELGVTPDIQMGTLGKAVGVSGAYVAGSSLLIDLLINKARSLIYTTAAPPGVIGSALAALRIIASAEGSRRRASLASNVSAFHQLVKDRLSITATPSHIVPLRIGDSIETMQISRRCLASDVFVHGIRYPTVPEGTARLRFTLMSIHTSEDIRTAASVLENAFSESRKNDRRRSFSHG
jgi:8-amino-7-oxononanoate synthase